MKNSECILISFGSNLGDRSANISQAISELEHKGIKFLKCSSLYETEPVGYEDQPDFYNAVCRIETELPPLSLLKTVKMAEKRVGRRKRFRWGPREIDIDILIYNDIIIKTDILCVPHREIANRFFIVKMMEEINPDIFIPGENLTVSSLIGKFTKKTVMKMVQKNILK